MYGHMGVASEFSPFGGKYGTRNLGKVENQATFNAFELFVLWSILLI